MTKMVRHLLLLCLLGIIYHFQKAGACTLCGSVKLVSTFREDFSNPWVNFVAAGRLGKATLNPDGTGMTEFGVRQVFRNPMGWNENPVLSFEKYLPGGEKSPESVTVFVGNWQNNRLIPMRAIRLDSQSNLPAIGNQITHYTPPNQRFLADIFPRLALPEPELAADAFMEWAKADDALVTAAAKTLSPALVRKLIQEPKTPPERLGLLSFLLGCCGNLETDSLFFEQAIQSQDLRWKSARDGLLAGLVLLNPPLGWKMALESISSSEKPLLERLATLRAMKMLHATGFVEYCDLEKREMAIVFETALGQKDLADIAIDYLRTWKQTRLEKQVLSSFPARGEGPLLSRSVLQYAFSFRDRPACAEFLEKVKKDQPDLMREIEEIYRNSP